MPPLRRHAVWAITSLALAIYAALDARKQLSICRFVTGEADQDLELSRSTTSTSTTHAAHFEAIKACPKAWDRLWLAVVFGGVFVSEMSKVVRIVAERKRQRRGVISAGVRECREGHRE